MRPIPVPPPILTSIVAALTMLVGASWALPSIASPVAVESNDVETPSPVALPSPPPLGAVVFFNSMLADDPNPMPRNVSPSGLVITEHVGEGYIVKVRGRGSDDGSPRAALSPSYVNTRDGEVRVEAKVVSGPERAMIILTVRGQSDRDTISSANAYWAFFGPMSRSAGLLKRLASNDPTTSTLARTDQPIPSMRPDDWNAFAVRLQGSRIWLLVNDEPVVYAEDMSLANGETLLNLIRSGDPEDRYETAAVFRNWQISELAR